MNEKNNELLKMNIKLLKIWALYPRPRNANCLVKAINFGYKLVSTSFLYYIWIACIYDICLGGREKLTDYAFNIMNVAAGVLMLAAAPLLLKGRHLAIPGEYPYEWQKTPYYECTYLAQVYGQLIVGSVTSAADTFFIVALLLTAEQFKILACNFRNCIQDVLLEFEISKEDVIRFFRFLQETDSTKSITASRTNRKDSNILDVLRMSQFDKRLYELLINYIKDHQKLLWFCTQLENFFWPIILIKVAISMFYHTFITFAMVSSTDTTLKLTLVQYEMCAVLELLVFAIAGQTLIDQSEKLLKEVSSTPWYLCNKQFKTSIQMVLLRCAYPASVSIGKLTEMSLPAFIVIMKTALSYFAVLRQMT